MPTLCPNCLHPLRTNAKYCGYCGTSLAAAPVPASATSLPGAVDAAIKKSGLVSISQQEPKKRNLERSVLISLTIFLILVIVVAVCWQYWPVIVSYLGQLIPLLRPR